MIPTDQQPLSMVGETTAPPAPNMIFDERERPIIPLADLPRLTGFSKRWYQRRYEHFEWFNMSLGKRPTLAISTRSLNRYLSRARASG